MISAMGKWFEHCYRCSFNVSEACRVQGRCLQEERTMTERKEDQKPAEAAEEKTTERTTEQQPGGATKTTEKEVTKRSESTPEND